MKKIIYMLTALLFLTAMLFSAIDSKSMYEQGMDAFNSGNYSSSELLFRKLMDAGNDDEYSDRAWFYTACSIFYQKKYKSAVYEFNSFLNKCRASTLCLEARYWIGESLFALKDNAKAMEEYSRFIQNSKDPKLVPAAHDRRGMIYSLQKRYDEAILEWEAAIRQSGDKEKNAVRVMKIGEALFLNKKYDDSLTRLNPLLTSNADIKIVSRARLIVGQIHQIRENYNNALIVLNAIPNNLLYEYPFKDAYYFKAIALIKLGAVAQARPLLELFVNIGKDSEWYHNSLYELGNILILYGEDKKGYEMLNEVRGFASRPELKAAASKVLSRAFIGREPEKAIPYLKDALSVEDPEEQKEMMILLAKAYMSLKKTAEAGQVLDSFLEKYSFDKKSDEVKFLRGRVYLEAGDTDRAVALFDAIQKENPFSKFNNEISFYQALVNYRKGNYPAALILLKQYLGRNDVEYMYDAAVISLEIYIKTEDPKNTDAMAGNLIRNYQATAGVEQVIFRAAEYLGKKGYTVAPYFDFILNKYPESETAMNIFFLIGMDHFNRKEYEKAIENFNRCLAGKKKENRPHAYFYKMAALYNLKKHAEFISVFEKEKIPALDVTQWRELQVMLYRSYYISGKFEKIYNLMYNDDLANYHKPELLLYAVSALKVGDLETAKKVTGQLTDNRDLYAEALHYLGRYYQDNNKPDDAMEYYLKIIDECPLVAEYTDNAKVGIAEILIQQKRFQEAFARLAEVKSAGFQNKKNAMLIVSSFESGEKQKAAAYTELFINELLQSDEGEIAVKYNLDYYYKEKNPVKLDQFWYYALKYQKLNRYSDFLVAKLGYETQNYQKAYNFFYKVIQQEGPYSDEALFCLGMISLYVFNNPANAQIFFSRSAGSKGGDPKLKVKSRINCAILSMEKNNPADSKAYLDGILTDSDRGAPNSQAKNLYEAFSLGGGVQ